MAIGAVSLEDWHGILSAIGRTEALHPIRTSTPSDREYETFPFTT